MLDLDVAASLTQKTFFSACDGNDDEKEEDTIGKFWNTVTLTSRNK